MSGYKTVWLEWLPHFPVPLKWLEEDLWPVLLGDDSGNGGEEGEKKKRQQFEELERPWECTTSWWVASLWKLSCSSPPVVNTRRQEESELCLGSTWCHGPGPAYTHNREQERKSESVMTAGAQSVFQTTILKQSFCSDINLDNGKGLEQGKDGNCVLGQIVWESHKLYITVLGLGKSKWTLRLSGQRQLPLIKPIYETLYFKWLVKIPG